MTVRVMEHRPNSLITLVEQGSSLILVRVTCWLIAIALGAADAWVTRFTMYPDGVSYLDLGDAIWRGNWHNAINGYWSPLYPAVLGIFFKLFRPSMEQEYPLVHLVNFFIYLVALISFECFFKRFVAQQRERERNDSLPSWAWYVIGYSAFISSSLLLISVRFVSGDMGIAAVVFVACALLLKIRSGDSKWTIFACLGLVLGIGYLIKAVMFLMSIPFFGVAAVIQHKPGRNLKPVALSILMFIVVAGPWIGTLSKAKGRPTFGDTGKINYAINVSAVNFFIPKTKAVAHPVHQIGDLPAYEYSEPISGTYPLWYDPSYWHEGIEPHFSLKKQVFSILTSLLALSWISFNVALGLNISMAILFLYLTAATIPGLLGRLQANWALWIPGFSGIALYSLVVIEARYVGALFCLLWIVAFSGLCFTTCSRKLIRATVVLLGFTTCAVEAWGISGVLDKNYFARRHIASPVSAQVASALKTEGLQAGDKIAVLGDWLVPSQEASYVARLARLRIIGEARPAEFWSAAPGVRSLIFAEFARAGAKAVLAFGYPPSAEGCRELATTDYYLCGIASAK